MAYLDTAGFRDLTIAPTEYVEAIEEVTPGWVQSQLDYWSRWMDSRLAKRYAVPFNTPYPVAMQGWLARIVTYRVYLRRGIDPTDQQVAWVKEDHDNVTKELAEAANSEDGLFELPLLETGGRGITKGGPFGYSEQSPYAWMDRQADVARDEDANGSGTFG